MINITIRERCKGAEPRVFRTINDDTIEWSYDVIPYMAGIDHMKFKADVVDEHGNRIWDEFTTEYCPCCDSEVDIPSFGVSYCPNCGERILPCSMCDANMHNCSRCPYERSE